MLPDVLKTMMNRHGYPDYEAFRRNLDIGRDVRGRVVPDAEAKESGAIVADIVTRKRKMAEKKQFAKMVKAPETMTKAALPKMTKIAKMKKMPKMLSMEKSPGMKSGARSKSGVVLKAGNDTIVGGVDLKMDAIKTRSMKKK
jgi:hypothetical protein